MKGIGKKSSSKKLSSRKKTNSKIFLFISIIILVVVLDQIMKFISSKNILFNFSKNYGAGFSILQGHLWLFISVALLFIAVIIFNYKKIPQNNIIQTSFALFLGGTISNLIDRIFRGFVIDYFDFKLFINNLADITITIGALMIAYYYLFKK